MLTTFDSATLDPPVGIAGDAEHETAGPGTPSPNPDEPMTPGPDVPGDPPTPLDPPPIHEPETPRYPRQDQLRGSSSGLPHRSGEQRNLASLAEQRRVAREEGRRSYSGLGWGRAANRTKAGKPGDDKR